MTGSLPWQPCDSFSGNSTDSSLTAHRPCPVCGADQPQEFLRRSNFQFFTDSAKQPKRTDLIEVQCGVCRAIYLDPAYTDIGFTVLFSEAGCSYGATEARPQEQIEWLTGHNLLSPGRSILDVGCYDGRFLAQMPDWVRRVGVDIDGPAIKRGRELYNGIGLELIHSNFNQFSLGSPPDTICLFHVLEHLPEPVTTLAHLRSQASPNTHLVVEVPILELGFTNDINSFFSAQHMTHFSRRSLVNTLARAGWVSHKELEQKEYNGYRLLCRPTSPALEARPNSEDDATLTQLLDHISITTEAVRMRVRLLEPARQIIIWGGGMHTEFLYHLTNLFNDPTKRFIIVDQDPLKQGKSWRGISILPPDALAGVDWLDTWLAVSSYAGTPAIIAEAERRGIPHKRIIQLYDCFRVY